MNKPFYKKAWFWVLVVLGVLVIGGTVSYGQKEPTKVGSSEGTQTSSTDKDSQNTSFTVGDIVAIDGQEINVQSVDRNVKVDNPYFTPAEGKEYVRIHLQIKNTSSSTMDYNSLYWTIEDDSGDIANYSSALFAQADDALDSGQLASGGIKNASLTFEVPANSTNLKVHFKPSIVSSHEAVINL